MQPPRNISQRPYRSTRSPRPGVPVPPSPACNSHSPTASDANASGFLYGFIERAHQHSFKHTPPPCARPIKHLRHPGAPEKLGRCTFGLAVLPLIGAPPCLQTDVDCECACILEGDSTFRSFRETWPLWAPGTLLKAALQFSVGGKAPVLAKCDSISIRATL